MMAEEDTNVGYTWEGEYEKTWENLQEDAHGSLQTAVDDEVHRAKRRKLLERPINVRLGMMRHMYLVIDMSKSMLDQDLKPTRQAATIKLLEHFIEEYFDQNPISQLGILITQNKRAEKITEIGGNPRRHISALQGLASKTCDGEPSLQNALELATQSLRHMPSHASREILVVFGSLTTCDPGDISQTAEMLKNQSIRCSLIGLSAAVYVCKNLAHYTKGQYNVILHELNFKEILTQHVAPPPAVNTSESAVIKMGFPHQNSGEAKMTPSMCMCHLDSAEGADISVGGYLCPQCGSKYCELPVECKACGLTLVSAPHLARSYHHLFPLPSFQESQTSAVVTNVEQSFCSGCQTYLSAAHVSRCKRCHSLFCIDCDIFVHETLHCCPGCAASRHTQVAETH